MTPIPSPAGAIRAGRGAPFEPGGAGYDRDRDSRKRRPANSTEQRAETTSSARNATLSPSRACARDRACHKKDGSLGLDARPAGGRRNQQDPIASRSRSGRSHGGGEPTNSSSGGSSGHPAWRASASSVSFQRATAVVSPQSAKRHRRRSPPGPRSRRDAETGPPGRSLGKSRTDRGPAKGPPRSSARSAPGPCRSRRSGVDGGDEVGGDTGERRDRGQHRRSLQLRGPPARPGSRSARGLIAESRTWDRAELGLQKVAHPATFGPLAAGTAPLVVFADPRIFDLLPCRHPGFAANAGVFGDDVASRSAD